MRFSKRAIISISLYQRYDHDYPHFPSPPLDFLDPNFVHHLSTLASQSHTFPLQCQRRAEREYPQPRGLKKASLNKYIVGGGALAGIIIVIWFPLVLFALGNTVGKANLPTDMTMSIRIGAYAPIYQYTAQNDSIFRYGITFFI